MGLIINLGMIIAGVWCAFKGITTDFSDGMNNIMLTLLGIAGIGIGTFNVWDMVSGKESKRLQEMISKEFEND